MNSTTYRLTVERVLHRDGELLDGAAAQGVPLPLRREQAQLLPLLLAQAVAVPTHQDLLIPERESKRTERKSERKKEIEKERERAREGRERKR